MRYLARFLLILSVMLLLAAIWYPAYRGELFWSAVLSLLVTAVTYGLAESRGKR